LLYSPQAKAVTNWEELIERPLHALRLESITRKILVFAVLATVIPTIVTTVVLYRHNQPSLTDQIAQELRSVSSETAREMDLWLNERLHDLRVAASSYVVSENVAKIRPGSEGGQAVNRLRDYLSLVRGRFTDYEALLVIDPRGRVVASSAGRTGSVQLPLDRLNDLRTGDALLGEAFWDATLGKAAIMLAVPIRQADGRFLGVFAGKISLRSVADVLRRLAPSDPGDVYLMTDQGKLVIRSRVSSQELMRTKLPKTMTQALFEKEGTSVVYKRLDGQEVVGVLQRVPQFHWAAVAETPRAEAFREVARLRNVTVVTLILLLAGSGLLAYLVGLLIARPLGRLTSAAAKVAAGDLSIDLRVGGGGEVGYLGQVFNSLVARLRERESQGELERLSVTDALTGLYNRRHLMGTLATEAQRSRRLRRTFAVLLADVDHFKQYNDAHGHLAGDTALVKIADILRKTTRAVDCVARYGGEEFLVMLLETTIATAALVADRIRGRVAAEEFAGGKITMSIGVAEFPAHGDTPESLIASADAAMYQAKGEGRDRVVALGEKLEQQKKKRRKGPA
jgi:diguanylate cyclase (GGDEF)-like protein